MNKLTEKEIQELPLNVQYSLIDDNTLGEICIDKICEKVYIGDVPYCWETSTNSNPQIPKGQWYKVFKTYTQFKEFVDSHINYHPQKIYFQKAKDFNEFKIQDKPLLKKFKTIEVNDSVDADDLNVTLMKVEELMGPLPKTLKSLEVASYYNQPLPSDLEHLTGMLPPNYQDLKNLQTLNLIAYEGHDLRTLKNLKSLELTILADFKDFSLFPSNLQSLKLVCDRCDLSNIEVLKNLENLTILCFTLSGVAKFPFSLKTIGLLNSESLDTYELFETKGWKFPDSLKTLHCDFEIPGLYKLIPNVKQFVTANYLEDCYKLNSKELEINPGFEFVQLDSPKFNPGIKKLVFAGNVEYNTLDLSNHELDLLAIDSNSVVHDFVPPKSVKQLDCLINTNGSIDILNVERLRCSPASVAHYKSVESVDTLESAVLIQYEITESMKFPPNLTRLSLFECLWDIMPEFNDKLQILYISCIIPSYEPGRFPKSLILLNLRFLIEDPEKAATSSLIIEEDFSDYKHLEVLCIEGDVEIKKLKLPKNLKVLNLERAKKWDHKNLENAPESLVFDDFPFPYASLDF